MAQSKPDYGKLFFVNLPGEKGNVFSGNYHFTFSNGNVLNTKQENGDDSQSLVESRNFLMQKKPVQIPVNPTKKRGQRKRELNLDKNTLDAGIQNLLKQNDELIYKLNRMAKDTIIRQDSILRTKVKDVSDKVESYHGKIKELKKLFETYKKEDLGKKARNFQEIIHKMVELKTALAGAKSDISYQDVDVEAMITAIDHMIDNYLEPFSTKTVKQNVQWNLTVTPDENKKLFQFGLRKGPKREYFWEKQNQGKKYLASIDVRFKLTQPASLKTFTRKKEKVKTTQKPKGLYYNLPASGTMVLSLNYRGNDKHFPLGQTQIMVPQLGETAALPTLNPESLYHFDPFHGTIKSIHYPKAD